MVKLPNTWLDYLIDSLRKNYSTIGANEVGLKMRFAKMSQKQSFEFQQAFHLWLAGICLELLPETDYGKEDDLARALRGCIYRIQQGKGIMPPSLSWPGDTREDRLLQALSNIPNQNPDVSARALTLVQDYVGKGTLYMYEKTGKFLTYYLNALFPNTLTVWDILMADD